MTFAILRLFDIYIPFPSPLIFNVWILLFILSFAISLLYHKLLAQRIQKIFTHQNGRPFNAASIVSPSDAIDAIRGGIVYGSDDICSEQFLSYCTANAFSERLFPEICRICVAYHIPLRNIAFPTATFVPKRLVALFFLAYETILLMDQQYQDENNIGIEQTINDLTHAKNDLMSLIDSFWTESDSSRSSLTTLGLLSNTVVNKFQAAVERYPKSQQIMALWTDFTSNVLSAPIPLTAINLKCLPITSEMKHPPERVAASSRFIEGFNKRSLQPIRNWMLSSLIQMLFIMIIVMIVSTLNMIDLSSSFESAGQFRDLAVSLAYRAFHAVDSVQILPSAQVISSQLGISVEEAELFRSAPQSIFQETRNLSSLIIPGMERVPARDQCVDVSVIGVLHYTPPTNINAHSMWCYIINSLDNQYLALSNDYQWLDEWMSKTTQNIVIWAAVISVIALIHLLSTRVVFSRLNSGRRTMLRAVRHCLLFRKDYYETREVEVTMSWIGILAILVLYIGIYIVAVSIMFFMRNSLHTKMWETMTQISIISNITHQTFMSLALTELSFYLNDPSPCEEIVEQLCLRLIVNTQSLIIDGVNATFDEVPVVGDWTDSVTSFAIPFLDFAQLLLGRNLRISSFRFLQSRYLSFQTAAPIFDAIVPRMVSAGHFAIIATFSSYYLFIAFGFALAAVAWIIAQIVSYLLKMWFKGASTIVNRAMANDPENSRFYQLLLSGHRFELLDMLPYPIVIVDDDEVITICNPSFALLVDYTVEQLIGQHLADIMDISNEIVMISDRSLKITDEEFDDEFRFISFIDITQEIEERQKEIEFIAKVMPTNDLGGDMVYIVARNGSPLQIEPEFSNIHRVAVEPSYYRAVIADRLAAAQFATKVASQGGCVALMWDNVRVITVGLVSSCIGEFCDNADRAAALGKDGEIYADPMFAEIDGFVFNPI